MIQKVKINLSNHEAQVFFEFLSIFSKKDNITFDEVIIKKDISLNKEEAKENVDKIWEDFTRVIKSS